MLLKVDKALVLCQINRDKALPARAWIAISKPDLRRCCGFVNPQRAGPLAFI